MKNSLHLLLLFFLIYFLPPSSFAQKSQESNQIENSNWPDHRPQTLIPKRKVWSLFGPKKMGAARNMEWQVRPLFFFVSPHLGLKKYWKQNKNGLQISSFHQINYPSIFLNLIAREGAGGVLPMDSQIPPMLSLKNEILIGFNRQGNFITFRGGLVTAFKLGSKEKNFPDIDFPFLYHRTLAFNHSPNFYLGINYNKNLHPKWNLEADLAAYHVDFKSNDFVFENRLVGFWKKSDRFGLKLGVAAAYGAYPYGFDFRAIPVFDLLFGFGNN